MRLPRKIYPFAIIISFTLVLLVFYILNQGDFEKLNHSSIRLDVAKENKVLYVGYNLTWSGYGKPTIKEVTFLNNERNSEFQQLHITPYVETSSHQITDILTEEEVINGNYELNYSPVLNYKINKDQFRLVLKFVYTHESDLAELAHVQIKYNTFGIIKEKTIHIANVVE